MRVGTWFASRFGVMLLLASSACTNVHRYARSYGELSFDELLVVTPSEWSDREALEAFVDHKRANGFEVTILPVDLSMNAPVRLEHVRDQLRQHAPTEGAATAVLILGDLEMIPAGPWSVEGVTEKIYSDVPVTITHENAPALDESVQWEDLEGQFETHPAHVVGRIPFGDPQLVDSVLASSMHYEQLASERKENALFAAAPWGPPLAVGIIVDGARDAMTERGWDAVMYGADGSPDRQLGGPAYITLSHVQDRTRETLVICGLRVSMRVSLQEPLDRLPEARDGLSWSMIESDAKPAEMSIQVTGFVPFSDELDSMSTISLVQDRRTDQLQKLAQSTIARLLDALAGELGRIPKATLAFSTAGVTIKRMHEPTARSCTCNETWSNGRCDGCGAEFTSIRETMRLDTVADFRKRHADGTIPRKSQVEMNGITSAWVRTSPALVYTIGHGGRFSNGWESTLQFVVSTTSIAAESLAVRARESSFEFKVGEELQPTAPTEPAVLFATGCAIAAPGDPLLRELFVDRWIVAYLGATMTVGPYPILASTNAESHIARYLSRGLPLGLAGHATLAGYLNDARLDPTLYLVPGVIEGMRTNLASYILFGDPTLSLPSAAP